MGPPTLCPSSALFCLSPTFPLPSQASALAKLSQNRNRLPVHRCSIPGQVELSTPAKQLHQLCGPALQYVCNHNRLTQARCINPSSWIPKPFIWIVPGSNIFLQENEQTEGRKVIFPHKMKSVYCLIYKLKHT